MLIKNFTSILFLVMLINWGCNQSGEQKNSVNEQIPQKEQIKVPEQQKTPSGDLDQYGRSPGDAHYGHDHPSEEPSAQKIDSIQKPALGEPDQYGRKPGDPHYGHNHQ